MGFAIIGTIAQAVLGIGFNKKNPEPVKIIVETAVREVSRDRSRRSVEATAEAIKDKAIEVQQQLPVNTASQSLWPQLIRYGLAMVGMYLVGAGYVDKDDWEALIPLLMGFGPVIYRIVQTWWARYKVLRASKALQ